MVVSPRFLNCMFGRTVDSSENLPRFPSPYKEVSSLLQTQPSQKTSLELFPRSVMLSGYVGVLQVQVSLQS